MLLYLFDVCVFLSVFYGGVLCCCRGVFDIVIQKDGVSRCVGQYDNKGSFGELALMYNTPRAATIISTQDGALWALVRH